MTVTCQQCDREVSYHELDAHTVFADGDFDTAYRCPYCEAVLDGVSVS